MHLQFHISEQFLVSNISDLKLAHARTHTHARVHTRTHTEKMLFQHQQITIY